MALVDAKNKSVEIGRLLAVKNKTLAIAESCTGGYISHLITLVPGSSVYFIGAIVAYDNSIKIAELNVSEKTLAAHGAVSIQCAKEMAEGILKKFNADYALSTTGIAGPTGETPGKPVGTVCIALAVKGNTSAEIVHFNGSREEIIRQTAEKALEILLRFLQK